MTGRRNVSCMTSDEWAARSGSCMAAWVLCAFSAGLINA